MIQFLLNNTLKTLTDVAADTTVLNWLRGDQRRCGTKEGCASGDCGACTVVLGQPDGDAMRYDTANSCILLVSQLQGKQLLTVEDLAHSGRLHPVQQAMADCHASQCGFCTPGFVMSLFALNKAGGGDRHAIEQQLAGNLCRCTGYRPIIDAAQTCAAAPDQFSAAEAQTVSRLRALAQPQTLDQLAEFYCRHPDARLLAGGTDLALSVTQQHQRLPQLIALHQVEELKAIHIDEQEIRIGAAASIHACQQALAAVIPAFSRALGRFASRQVRNQGTLGGNLANASPIGDGAPMLLALGARLELRRGAERRELPLEAFFLAYRRTALRPGELISRIVIPRVTVSPVFAAWKVSKRLDDDISTVFGAFNIALENGVVSHAAIAFGGMAATPARAMGCERALLGRPINGQTLESACQALAADFQPLSDFRGSGRYRLAVAQNLLRRWALRQENPQLLEVENYVG